MQNKKYLYNETINKSHCLILYAISFIGECKGYQETTPAFSHPSKGGEDQ